MKSVAISMDDKDVVEAATKSFEREVHNSKKKFEDEFEFSKMDTMIHRFPPGLGEISSRYPSMVVPRFVAIGPYHHDKKHLKKMEPVKKAAAQYLFQRSQKLAQAVKAAAHYLCQRKHSEKLELDDATKEVLDGVEEALRKYIADETVVEEDMKEVLAVIAAVEEARDKYIVDDTISEEGMMKDSAHFADMILCDACFLLLYMDAYSRSYGDKEDPVVNKSMRRFLFSNRDSINNDIMLLENQLPWRVIQVLMRLGSESGDEKLENGVGKFIEAMGSSFKIRESSKLEPYVWDDEENPPPHLLALLRRHKTEDPGKMIHSASAELGGSSTSVDVLSDDDVENNNNHLLTPSNTPEDPLIHQALTPPSSTSSSAQEGNPQAEVVISAISPMDLKEIGIELTASPTAKFSDMGLKEGWLWSRLTLAPLSLGDTRASCLVNMAAFEVCIASRFGDPAERTAVCSYLALLAFFMVGSEDVRKLRSMGVLNGPDSDDDMLAFFKTLMKHLPDYGTHFAFVMRDIEDYKDKRRIRTTVYKWLYNNYVNIIKVATVLGTLIGLYRAFLSLVHKN